MGWERRDRGGRYYYRKEREVSRVRSVYVGSGIVAGLVEQRDKQERGEKAAERAALRREIERQDAIDERIDATCDLVGKLVTAALAASGFHQHKRQWRRKRDGKEE